MKTKLFMLAGSFLFYAGFSQMSDDKKDFESWDSDNNGKISKKEYSLNSQMFDKWDENDDNRLSQSEFQDAYFALFDADSDGNLQSDELSDTYFLLPSSDSASRTSSQGDNQMGDQDNDQMRYGAGTETLGKWDADNNGKVSEDEFKRNVNAFNSIDQNKDNYISKTELYNKTFNWWDQDHNGSIEKSEFEEMKQVRKDQSFWEKIF